MQHNIDSSNAIEFFSKNDIIFITGGSGFIGISLIEKVLRSLPQVQKIYVLLRVRPESSVQERYEKLLKNRVFDTLKGSFSSEQEFRDKIGSKIVPIQGDISYDDLGISSEDLSIVADTKIFIHSAASINFDDPLETAFNLNTLGTLRALSVAKKMAQLQAFVQISTAFVSARNEEGPCKETLDPFLLGNPHEILDKLTKMSKAEFSDYENNVVLKKYINTYIFTKTLTEHIIQSKTKEYNIPLVVIRPSIVTPALVEPVKGWIQGVAGLAAPMLLCGLGKVQEWAGNNDIYIDFIPIDMVCGIVLSGAATVDHTAAIPRIYNVSISHRDTIILRDILSTIEKYWRSAKAPRKRSSSDIRCRMYPTEEFKKRYQRRFAIPLLMAKLPRGGNIKEKLDKLYAISTLFISFSTVSWLFDNTNSMKLDNMAPKELRCYLNRDVDWAEYFRFGCIGVHDFILNDLVDQSQVVTPEFRKNNKSKFTEKQLQRLRKVVSKSKMIV